MNKKLALGMLCLALASGCAGTPRWDVSGFPQQPVYDDSAATAQTASTSAAK